MEEQKKELNMNFILITALVSFVVTMAFIYFGLKYIRTLDAERPKIENVKQTNPINFNFLRLMFSKNEILSSIINNGTQATNAKMVKGSNQLALNNKALIRANKRLGVFLITIKWCI